MWHPVHSDLFAVSYGSFDWVRQGAGGVAVFTLKNTSAPEHYFTTDCGAPRTPLASPPPRPLPPCGLGHLSTPERPITHTQIATEKNA